MQVVEESHKKSDRVGMAALLVSLGTLLSRIFGYVREMLLTAYFSRTVTDAWLVAFRLPNMFRRLLGEGALAVSFIPVFNSLLKPNAPELKTEAERLVSGFFTLLFAVLITITGLGIFFSEEIVAVLTKGEAYSGIPGKVELTVHLARIMFVYVLLVSSYAYFMAILNTLRKFLLPALAPVLWNLSMIGAMLLHSNAETENGEYLAWGVVVGGILQVGVLVPPLYRAGFLPRFSQDLWNRHIKAVFKGLGPSLIGLGILQMTILVNTRFASYLPEGTNTWIYIADRILELPLSIFAVSLGTALLPTLSSQWNEERHDDFFNTANYYLRSVLLLAIPAFLACLVLPGPIIESLFGRRNYTPEDVQATSQVLQIYSMAILTYSGVRVLSPCFYAIKNTWYPAICSLSGLVVHVLLAPVLIKSYGLQGLIFSTITSSFVNVFLLFFGFRFLIGRLHYTKLIKAFFRFVSVGVIPFLIFYFYAEYVFQQLSVSWMKILSLGAVLALGAAIYIFTCSLLGFEEVRPIVLRLRARFSKK